MKVSEAMSHPVEVIGPDVSVVEAAERMRDAAVGALPVVERERLIGMVTDRDLAIRVIAGRLDPASTPVRDVMTPRMISCLAADEVTFAARLMVRNGVRRLPALSADGTLVGIVSIDDLAILFSDETPAATVAPEPTAGVMLDETEVRALRRALDNYLPELSYEVARVERGRYRRDFAEFERTLVALRRRLSGEATGEAEAPPPSAT